MSKRSNSLNSFAVSGALAAAAATSGNDILTGGTGNDSIKGLAGNDTLSGLAGNDTLNGGVGNDVLTGGLGADRFVFDARGFGRDTITDFKLGDLIHVAGLQIGDLATLLPFIVSSGSDTIIDLKFNSVSEQIVLKGVNRESLVYSSFVYNSSTVGFKPKASVGDDVLFGGRGNDTLSGLAGADKLSSGSGNDKLYGGDGNDVLYGGAGDDTFYGGTGSDLYRYTAREFGQDVIIGFEAADRIDLSVTGVANFAMLRAHMTQVGANTVLDLGFNGSAERITLSGIQLSSLQSSNFVYASLSSPVTPTGTAFNDVLFGTNSSDSLNGADGDDKLSGGSGDDTLTGGLGDDRFVFEARDFGDDQVTDFTRGDLIDLSALGIPDLATLQRFMTSLNGGTVISMVFGGSGERLTINGPDAANLIESDFIFHTLPVALLPTGTGSNDIIFGSIGDDVLKGLGSNDTLTGAAGNDSLSGGTGNDRLLGGIGSDTFVFDTIFSSAGSDGIVDFAVAADKIALYRSAFPIFAAASAGGLSVDAFRAGTAATNAAQHIVYDRTTGALYYDPDGLGGISQTRFATLENKALLSASDFILI